MTWSFGFFSCIWTCTSAKENNIFKKICYVFSKVQSKNITNELGQWIFLGVLLGEKLYFYILEVILSMHSQITSERVSFVSYHSKQTMMLWRQFLIHPFDII